jgi:hypothetical protein
MLSHSRAQEISFADSVDTYNKQRIKINKTGCEILGGWGVANIAEGGIGYFGAKEGQGKYFSEMNGIWGVINTGIAATGLARARRQAHDKVSYEQSYDRYLADRKIYLVNAGLDVLYVAAGVGLTAYGSSAKNNADKYAGFGKSLALQGVFLLIFDNIMILEHHRNSAKWAQLIGELRFTNHGIGFVHPFK